MGEIMWVKRIVVLVVCVIFSQNISAQINLADIVRSINNGEYDRALSDIEKYKSDRNYIEYEYMLQFYTVKIFYKKGDCGKVISGVEKFYAIEASNEYLKTIRRVDPEYGILQKREILTMAYECAHKKKYYTQEVMYISSLIELESKKGDDYYLLVSRLGNVCILVNDFDCSYNYLLEYYNAKCIVVNAGAELRLCQNVMYNMVIFEYRDKNNIDKSFQWFRQLWESVDDKDKNYWLNKMKEDDSYSEILMNSIFREYLDKLMK